MMQGCVRRLAGKQLGGSIQLFRACARACFAVISSLYSADTAATLVYSCECILLHARRCMAAVHPLDQHVRAIMQQQHACMQSRRVV
ncbi:hypothetical protein IE81DRAFT_197627 [Ceraceosorus guamensis]|uniref:Uncharacterized protein n=1 Tax=Ceraceosorus guamensis TaxID=1522189 RepID=A0A316VUT8_9BASI|nr:hypothetical protein IE81DRAFT_197627 [Ceraceosorus guamensis]PWN41024.1 hypothetical protein IE81DRAFT_197627 [Ceraceosorus guamensis]